MDSAVYPYRSSSSFRAHSFAFELSKKKKPDDADHRNMSCSDWLQNK